MVHQKILAFYKRSISSFTRSGTKDVVSARHPTKPITSQHLSYLCIHRGFVSRYSTSARAHRGNFKGNVRQGQIPAEPLANSSNSSRLYLVGFGTLITIVGGYFMYHSSERQGPIQARKLPTPRRLQMEQKTTIGGPFVLTTDRGEVVTNQDFIGHWTLIYFGYTSCPDDCPEELQKLADALEMIDEQTNESVMPVFVTIDPKRDSGAQLQAYLSEFHPRLLGLTGTVDGIRQVAREYRVFYKKVEEEGPDYLVDHSSLTYLMDPNMEFVNFFGKEYDAKSLSAEIREEIKRYKISSIL